MSLSSSHLPLNLIGSDDGIRNLPRRVGVDWFKKRAFYLISRVGLKLYSLFPLFGRLKGSFALIRQGSLILLIERNDGRGLSFPGGIQMPWEDETTALKREVREETGLEVTSQQAFLRYDTNTEIPVRLAVFEVQAEGQVRDSWEGTPCWLEPRNAQSRLLNSQRRIVDVILGSEKPAES
jgi:8-oxo-dGTP pyrophosphatase MutT (NUDIX family)